MAERVCFHSLLGKAEKRKRRVFCGLSHVRPDACGAFSRHVATRLWGENGDCAGAALADSQKHRAYFNTIYLSSLLMEALK